ncbi:MAG: ADP-forming succinate--CoA ligase subunit beta [Alphaproteobacteria bacterium]|nr:MAG: ADP-forming succinate--CoA ligase subunit beta [Alphaproteobacteria bacterium]
MNIHEHQAKALLADFDIPILRGGVAFSVEEASKAAKDLGGPVWVVKAQIHAGGRGKAGGVKVVKSLQEVTEKANEILGKTLVTHQTGPEGKVVRRLYIEDGCRIAKEFYLSLLIDRASSRVAVMASSEGGVDIEDVAEKTPEKIIHLTIDPDSGLTPDQLQTFASGLGLEGSAGDEAGMVLKNLYRAFVDLDASLLEVNPLVLTEDDHIVVLDAKMSFDENALFRHPDIAELRDETEEDPMETKAKEIGLSYIKLDGEIGCMVNGAGLAMATMDIIKLKGSEPANFLDVGGGATREKVTEAFKIILSDAAVKGILVNIFGGIMRCDIIADGIIAAAKEVHINVPLVVRLAGTKVKEGREILSNSGLAIIPADDLNDAAEKVVAAVKEAAK